jgi:uncharacterized membrane protein YqjE
MTPEPPNNGQPQNLATAVTDISERVTVLVREEIELAKAEVTEKVTRLVKGAVVALAAGIFAVTGLLFLLHAFSWLLNQEVFSSSYWGFFVVAGALFVLGGVAGYLAAKWLKTGAPTPDMAIDEAQRIRATLSGEPGGQLDAVQARDEAKR